MKNFHVRLSNRLKKRAPLALAVIVEAIWSSPQGAGASALFSTRGLVDGTLGGGILEANAEKKARRALETGKPLFFEYSLKGERALEGGTVCGGKVRILIDPRPGEDARAFDSLERSLSQGRAGVLITSLREFSAGKAVVERSWLEQTEAWTSEAGSIHPKLIEKIEEAFLSRRTALVKAPGEATARRAGRHSLLLEPVFPPPRLVVAGAGHIGQAICRLGDRLGFEVTVIDDRPEFASRKRLPQADRIVAADIGRMLSEFPFTPDTYLVIVTRGHVQDAAALRASIKSRAAYIGMIGSRHKIQLMRRAFLARGWATPSQFDRIHAPIGLPIQSKTVEEIAVSIAAELVLARSRNQDMRKMEP